MSTPQEPSIHVDGTAINLDNNRTVWVGKGANGDYYVSFNKTDTDETIQQLRLKPDTAMALASLLIKHLTEGTEDAKP